MSTPCLRTGRRAAVIAVIVAVELASAGFAIGGAAAAPGLTTVAIVSVDSATGMWAPAQPTAAVPAATVVTVVTAKATTPPVPITPAARLTTSTSTAPVEESNSLSEPQPTTRS